MKAYKLTVVYTLENQKSARLKALKAIDDKATSTNIELIEIEDKRRA